MPQPAKKLDPGQSPQAWFGNELRVRRLAEKLSAKELGRLAQVSGDMILAIEKGQYPSCRKKLACKLDVLLDTGGVFERAWPMAFGNRDADKKRADADKRRSPNKAVSPTQVRTGRILGSDNPTPRPGSPEHVDRREFLQVTGLVSRDPVRVT